MQRLRTHHSHSPFPTAAARPADVAAGRHTAAAASSTAAAAAVANNAFAHQAQLTVPADADCGSSGQQQHQGHLDCASAATNASSAQPASDKADMMQVSVDDALLEVSAESETWFDSFDVGRNRQCSETLTAALQSNAGRTRCWGPPPPAQFPAMLRGTLAHAVLGGIAGKSLVNQVSIALQQTTQLAECILA